MSARTRNKSAARIPPRVPLPAGLRRYTGPAGASAQAEYERLRDLHRLGVRQRLPRDLIGPTVLGALGAAAVGTVILAAMPAPSVGALLGVLLVAVVLAVLPAAGRARSLYRIPEEVDRWRRGADGERATAVRLRGVEALGWPVLHDRALPGTSANVDHLVVGPGGVFVIDSKHWSGTLVWDGVQLWRGRIPLGSVAHVAAWEAAEVTKAFAPLLPDEEWRVPVRTVVVVHGAQVPFGALTTGPTLDDPGGVHIVGADVLSGWLDQQRDVFTPPQRALIASLLEQVLPPYAAAV